MFRKLPIVPADDVPQTKSPCRTTISAQKARTMLETELREIRNRLVRLEEEAAGVIPIRRTTPARKAA
jgi:hypothetical protein